MARRGSLIGDDLGGGQRPVAYDPRRLSPLAVTRLVDAMVGLLGAVDGLLLNPELERVPAAKLLMLPAAKARVELVRIGAILPDGAMP